ncbi:MAG: hypothetical protein ACR2IE_18290 [Candidatus Sumerlaeaceae bacterium]
MGTKRRTFLSPRAIRRLWWAPAAIWFLAWHFFGVWEVWRDPLNQVPGPLGDNIVMLWNLGWMRYALSHGDPGFWFPTAYYPQGFLFLFSTHTWLDGVLGFLFSPLLPRGPAGTVLWANIVQLFATTATGLLTMAALRQFGVRSWLIQLVGASALTFCWFRVYAGTGHYHFYGTQWMLAALLSAAYARRLLRSGFSRPGLLWSFVAGGLTGLSFLNDQTHAIFAAILFTCTMASLSFSGTTVQRQTVLASLAVGAIGAILISSIHLIPILRAVSTGQFTYKVAMLHVPRIVDATSILLPPDRHLMGGPFANLRGTHQFTSQEGAFLGMSGYLFIACGIAASMSAFRYTTRRRTLIWRSAVATVLGCLFLLFAYGELLTIGQNSYFWMPGRLLRHVPVLNNIRLLQRWIWPAQICLTVAGTSAIFYWWGTRLSAPRKALLLAWAALASAEGKWYPPAEPTHIHSNFMDPPGLVASIQKLRIKGGVLMMPMEKAYAHSNHLQFLGGYDIPVTTAYTARAPFDVTHPPWQGTSWTAESGEWLRDRQVSVVVFHDYEGTLLTSSQLQGYSDWIENARQAIPGLIVMNRNGVEVTVPASK